MSGTSGPFGLRASYHPSGKPRADQVINGIPSGYATAIYQDQPVQMNTAGQVVPTTIGAAFQGSFQGVEFTDSTGRRRVSNSWPASTTTSGTPNDPTYAWLYRDPLIEYEIQANASVVQAKIGDQANFTTISANSGASSGFSQVMLDTATITNNSTAQLRILDKALYVDNDWGDAFTILRVQIAMHQDVATIAAYGG